LFSAIKTKHLPANQNDLRVVLSCWTNYTFRVIAYNHIGASDPSPVYQSVCTTSTCQPKYNPTNVRALTSQTQPLIIEWEVRINSIVLSFLFSIVTNPIEFTGNKMGCTGILV